MACETAVVASAVGGIKEVVVEGETGLLIDVAQQNEAPFEPVDPDKFSRDLAEGINRVIKDDALRHKMAKAGRQRVEAFFDWKAIAKQTKSIYQSLINKR
jgi:glycosyltransferase involved in cell wall biosynthesis